MKAAWQPKRNFDWAKEEKDLFDNILPGHICETAMATCEFVIQGPESVGTIRKNWGKWIRTRMQTYGHHPTGMHAQGQGHWITADSHEAADIVLSCFGLSMDDVYDAYEVPETGEKFTVSLHDVVIKCHATQTVKQFEAAATA